MTALRPFELEVIRLMAKGVLSDEQIAALSEADVPDNYEYTGSGYLLTLRHPSLPIKRQTLSEPAVIGTVGNVQAGFVIFLGDKELTLECHTWGLTDVPANFRDREVFINVSPV